ncbi:MAG: UDP-N-acetylmuramate--L-alanine ligase [Niabella sp.]
MQEVKNIGAIKSIYFIGIGGIGMSAVARYFLSKGKRVSGYDKTESPLTKQLVNEGIDVHYTDDVDLIPKDVDLVVYTPAIPEEHSELTYYRQHGYAVVKRSDVLQLISESTFNICIAGTHGKTTTTTMTAHILRDSGYGCNAFLGGISANYDTNFWSSKRDVCVIEADEYDRSFLKLIPDIAVVTAMDADHLDIYGTEENVKQAFADFAGKVKTDGLLIKKFGLDKSLKASNVLRYSLQNDSADAYAHNIVMSDGGYSFDFSMPGHAIDDLRLNMGGMYNVENMVAAICIAVRLQIPADKIRDAVASFKGVKRRFQYIIKRPDLVFIDDYAHHPEELKALVHGVKALFPQKRFTLIFQPHLYSRTRDFANEFAAVLSEADRVILLPIYPARELPIDGVSSDILFRRINNDDKYIMSKEEFMKWVADDFSKNREKEFGEVLVTAGAGDIDNLVNPIKEILES